VGGAGVDEEDLLAADEVEGMLWLQLVVDEELHARLPRGLADERGPEAIITTRRVAPAEDEHA
jgi:hypothetical protein